ncbi:unnamed protein product, partial [Ectocarpus sp. 4 AP-2014]
MDVVKFRLSVLTGAHVTLVRRCGWQRKPAKKGGGGSASTLRTAGAQALADSVSGEKLLPRITRRTDRKTVRAPVPHAQDVGSRKDVKNPCYFHVDMCQYWNKFPATRPLLSGGTSPASAAPVHERLQPKHQTRRTRCLILFVCRDWARHDPTVEKYWRIYLPISFYKYRTREPRTSHHHQARVYVRARLCVIDTRRSRKKKTTFLRRLFA